VKWNVRNRRFYIADPEHGSVVFEVFKIQDGLIPQIEAFFRGNGQLHSGWGTGQGS